MSFFEIYNIAFEVFGYPISYVELIGTLFGLISVYFATRANILTWATGIVNEFFLFLLFFQVQLYADMILQIYFFVITLFGWYNWKHKPKKNSITTTNFKTRVFIVFTIITGTLVTGFFFANIHLYFPQYFKIAASFPYADSFVMVSSIIATVLLAKKKIETWYLWILVDIISICLFFKKGIVFLGIEYFIFLGLVTYGLLNWKKEMKHG